MADIEYINLRTLSTLLSVAPRTLRSWISDPDLKLPAYKVKGLLLFNWTNLAQWLEKFRVKAFDLDSIADELLTKFEETNDD